MQQEKCELQVLNNIEDGVIILDKDLKIHFWNKWMTYNTLISSEEACRKTLDEIFPEIDKNTLLRKIKTSLNLNIPTFYTSSTKNYFIKIPLKKITNQLFEFMQQQTTITPYDNEKELVTIIIYDKTTVIETNYKLEKKLEEIRELNGRLNRYLNVIDENVLIITTDTKGVIKYVSKAFSCLSGYAKEELIGQKPNLLRHPSISKELYKELWKNIQNGEVWHGEFLNRAKNGTEYWIETIISPVFDEEKEILEYTSTATDITDKKKIEHLSITDPLTKVYNRNKFNDDFEKEIALAKRYNLSLSFVILDIDFFKSINDNFGHHAGDSVLIEFASLIQRSIRNSDIFARWGGEEFVLLLPHTELKEAVSLAEKLREKIEEFHFKFAKKITCSMGVAEYKDGDESDTISRRADIALYRAKERGRNQVQTCLTS